MFVADRQVVGAVGRLVPQKAPQVFVQAARRVADEAPETLFLWVGSGPLEAEVQIRYRHRGAPALIEPLEGDRARITFSEPEHAVAPGQAAVFYRDDIVLGGGWIE